VRGRVLLGVLAAGVMTLLLAVCGPAVADPAWVWPLDGPRTVGRPFDPPATRFGPGHRGADLPGRPGQPVRAAGAGRVSYAGLLAGRGVVVVVHGDLRTTYEPVAATVHVGQVVRAGAVLGRLAAGHAACAAGCLHWGLLRGDAYLDPVQLVRRGASRLLPVPWPAGMASSGGQPETPGAPTPAPVAEPNFSLRAAEAPWGAAALIALVAGLALLWRPGRRPDDAPPGAAGAVGGSVGSARMPAPQAVAQRDEPGRDAELVDLGAERLRRRSVEGRW
jgi:murein DD-endopeptidase MepM/ murein hydrolase activator NlpD